MNDHIEAFQLRGRVRAVLVGREGDAFSTEVAKIQLSPSWGTGDRHGRPERLLDMRERVLLAHGLQRGSQIANFRQVSLICHDETEAIREALALPGPIPPGSLCENLVIEGIARFTSLPLGTMLLFQKPGGETKRTAAIVLWGENTPCLTAGEMVRQRFEDSPGLPKESLARLPSEFVRVALGRRGLVGCVYSPGFVHRGDEVLVCIPEQRPYLPPPASSPG